MLFLNIIYDFCNKLIDNCKFTGNIGYGLFNALGHKEHKPVTNMFINLLSAGEGYHDVHHNNPRKIRLNKFDLAGWVIERFFDVKKTRAT